MIDRSPFATPFTDSRVSMLMMKSITQQQHGGALLYLILLASRNDHRASDTRCGVSRKPGGSPWVPRRRGIPVGSPGGSPWVTPGGSPWVPCRGIPTGSPFQSHPFRVPPRVLPEVHDAFSCEEGKRFAWGCVQARGLDAPASNRSLRSRAGASRTSVAIEHVGLTFEVLIMVGVV